MLYQVITSSFSTGVIILVIKEAGWNTNENANFWPVTLSTSFSKILELLVALTDMVCDTQFGFCNSI